MINFYISEGLEGFDPYPVLVPAVPVGMDSSKLAISNVRSVRCSEDPVTITPDNIDPLHRQAEIDFLTGNGEAPPTSGGPNGDNDTGSEANTCVALPTSGGTLSDVVFSGNCEAPPTSGGLDSKVAVLSDNVVVLPISGGTEDSKENIVSGNVAAPPRAEAQRYQAPESFYAS